MSKRFIEVLRTRADLVANSKKAIEKAKRWKQPDAVVTDKTRKEKELDLKREEQLLAQVDAMSRLILSDGYRKFWVDKTIAFRRAIALFAHTQLQVAQQLSSTFETLHEEAAK